MVDFLWLWLKGWVVDGCGGLNALCYANWGMGASVDGLMHWNCCSGSHSCYQQSGSLAVGGVDSFGQRFLGVDGASDYVVMIGC